ncbi:GntP family gluconate:H+ symporter [Scopulibacillus daqui]|uniref:GntP family gluconate:H+ symporter n=1 Tax=Scopulibacillus daqui TaxID=1469162 RepID=A0ABS2PYV7_9BACL|nr:GntP family permease [Scopulibacillus daqui]MBM7645128.1 GntP family gluconate:H+ symporter [Scopulibacillus daqui]
MYSVFGLSHHTSLLLYALVAIILLIVLIAKVKWNPFVVLILVSILLGLVAGMKFPDIVKSVQDGVGSQLGSIAVIIGLGTMLGKMMSESGGADIIASTLIKRFGEKNVHWAMMFVALIVGIPVFFEVGLILLIPLVFTIARKANMSLLQIGIPLAAGLSSVHGLLPPHPAPMIAIDAFHASIGKTIGYAFIVAIPTAIIAGPVFGTFIGKRIKLSPSTELAKQFSRKDNHFKTTGFGITLFTILIPVILMLLSAVVDVAAKGNNTVKTIFDFIGNPIVALIVAVIFSFFSLGYSKKMSREDVSKFTSQCLAPTASIILIIGGGGAFKTVLINSGVGNAIADIASHTNISPLLFAWLVAALIRIATGSATVAMTTAAGIVTPIIAQAPDVNLPLLVLATGSGSLILSHVNDAGFWMVKEFFNMSVSQTFKSWTVMETLISVVSIIIILILNVIL